MVNKAIKFLAGFLGSIMTIIVLLKISSSFWGAFIGILASIAAGVYLLKNKKTQSIVAYGVLSSAIFVSVAAIIIWIFVYSAFQGIAN